MSTTELSSAVETAEGLSQIGRITQTFVAPSATFNDIKRGNRSWWMPLIVISLVGYALFAAIHFKVGWEQVAENAIRQNPKMEEKMAQSPAAQKDMVLKMTRYSIEGGVAATPVVLLIAASLGSLVLWGTINFIFGGRASYTSILAVWLYAALPEIIRSGLGAIVLFAGSVPESFNITNFAPTSVGAFLNPLETNAALYKLATSLDFTTIWTLVLLSIGTAIVANVKRSSGYLAVFGWWALIVLVGTGWTAAFS